MTAECCSSNQKTTIVACSGASNVGQISNQAVVELTREGFGKMFCLAAVGDHINNFVFSAQMKWKRSRQRLEMPGNPRSEMGMSCSR